MSQRVRPGPKNAGEAPDQNVWQGGPLSSTMEHYTHRYVLLFSRKMLTKGRVDSSPSPTRPFLSNNEVMGRGGGRGTF